MSEPAALPASESFATLLRRHRLAAGLSQEALAARAGLSERGISALERGVNRRPHLETVQLLATALDLSPAQRAALLAAARPDPFPAPPPSSPAAARPDSPSAESLPAPAGTLTFLLTDLEASTALWEQHEAAMRAAMVRHDALLDEVLAEHGGRRIKERGEGDATFAVFADPAAAVTAALALQQSLLAEPWPAETPIRVRMGLHTGIALLHGGDYYGPVVNRAARLRELGHGGQVLLAEATAALVSEHLPEGAGLRELGRHTLLGIREPVAVYQLCHPALPAGFPPLRSPQAPRHNLPAALAGLVGRGAEQAEVLAALAAGRLVTLIGTGGVGKTRLALAVAEELVGTYADGVWLVELAGLGEGALVAEAVAGALGVREDPGRGLPATLAEQLRDRRLLLLLDNCEHLLAACAGLVEALLRACPQVRLLATSREELGVPGERLCRVPSLPVPDLASLPALATLGRVAAVRLFLERAGARAAEFTLTAENAAAVAQICGRLEGIPLAIELAAGRVGGLPLATIAARLEQSLGLLTGGARTAPTRQQTMRGALDWSWALLGEPERILLRRLSVFAGGCGLGAAEAVCAGEAAAAGPPERPAAAYPLAGPCGEAAAVDRPGPVAAASPLAGQRGVGIGDWEVADLLGALVSKSLALLEDRPGTEARYRLLEPVRQYASEQLQAAGEVAAVRGRHLAWCVALAEEADPRLFGPEQRAWLDQLEAEHDNLRAALAWSLEAGAAGQGVQLAGALWRCWDARGHLTEGRRWLKEVLSQSDAAAAPAAFRARALNGAGSLAYHQGDSAEALALHEQCLVLRRELGDRNGIAGSLGNLGNVAHQQGNREEAWALFEECLAIFHELDDRWSIATALECLGSMAQEQGDFARSLLMHEESLVLRRELKDSASIAGTLIHLGKVAVWQGDHAGARVLYEESLTLSRECGWRGGIARSLAGLGSVAERQGDHAGARAMYVEHLALARELGDRWSVAESLERFARLAGAQGQPRRGAQLWGAAEGLRRALGTARSPSAQVEFDRALEALRAALGEEACDAAWATGLAMSPDEAIALALQVDPAG